MQVSPLKVCISCSKQNLRALFIFRTLTIQKMSERQDIPTCIYVVNIKISCNGEVNFFEIHGVIKCHTTFVARTELQQKYL